jgi:hypothetical protein
MAPQSPSSHLHGLPAVCSGGGEVGGKRKSGGRCGGGGVAARVARGVSDAGARI